jgi:hypothetical protein
MFTHVDELTDISPANDTNKTVILTPKLAVSEPDRSLLDPEKVEN